MTAKLARAITTLAERCLGDHRREWALAMRAEVEVAIRNGTPLTFAVGCLVGALREMPMHAHGRYALTSHVVSLALFPVAALLLVGTLAGFPFLPSGHSRIAEWIAAGGEPLRLMTPWNRGFAPALVMLIWALVAGHALMPWFIVERDWDRVATLARVNSAATVTLFLFIGALFLDVSFLLLPAVALGIELIAIWLLYRWQATLFATSPPAT